MSPLIQTDSIVIESLRKETKGISNAEEFCEPDLSISSGLYNACYYNPIPSSIVQQMIGKSYNENCPIPITDLAYLQVTHYNMNGEITLGELIVHVKIAKIVMDIFHDIFVAKFPIEKMYLIDKYDAIDEQSMGDNNTSAFCFRDKLNKSGFISNHGLGIAIDVNPLYNPYVKEDIIAPSNGLQYAERSLQVPGMIQPDDAVVSAFKKRGFTWGGEWVSLKDYQHFEIDGILLGIRV